MSLFQYLKLNGSINPCSILKITIKLIDILEVIHQIGFTHNDIKMPNIMLDQHLQPILIDFGFAKKYTHKKEHIKREIQDEFEGNIMFASINQMLF